MFKQLKTQIRIFKIRTLNYEYWVWWAFFVPIIPFYLYYAFRLRNLVYFTAANPGIEFGGFFGEKKHEILQHIPTEYVAKSAFFPNNNLEKVLDKLKLNDFDYPLIFKPDVGERGDEVRIVGDIKSLEALLKGVSYSFIIQEYIDFSIELGVFYARLPNQAKGRVISLVRKGFLTVVGDGLTTVEQLLMHQDRGLLQLKRLRKERAALLSAIPAKGESIVVEPIGNHCLGTEFINANHLINEQLNSVFDDVSVPFEGFYFGRYDMKVKSIEEMYNGKGIKIFELNGVTSEPGHIYDKEMTLFKAYRDIIKNQKLVYQIAKQNLTNKAGATRLSDILQRIRQHFFKAKR